MKITVKLLARLGLVPLLVILSVGSVSAQADLGKTILDKLTARIAKLENACANDIKKYCLTVTPGEGRMIYCMQAHENKISTKCAFELGEAATSVQSRDKRRMWKGSAGPGPDCCVPAVEQIDRFSRLRGRHKENRIHGRSMRITIPG